MPGSSGLSSYYTLRYQSFKMIGSGIFGSGTSTIDDSVFSSADPCAWNEGMQSLEYFLTSFLFGVPEDTGSILTIVLG